MQKAFPFVIAVLVGYVVLTGAVLYMAPAPWNWLAAAVVLLMALRFVFAIRNATRLGMRGTARPMK